MNYSLRKRPLKIKANQQRVATDNLEITDALYVIVA